MNGNGKIVITGDCCPGIGRVEQPAINGKALRIFGEYLPVIEDAQLAITNLESPLTDYKVSIDKTGPALKSSPKTIEVLKNTGFNLVTLSNNHIMDYGREGLKSTLMACRDAGIETVGAGMSQEEIKKSYFCDVGGKRISVINVAENEFGTSQYGSPGGHSLDPVENYYSIHEAKKGSDRVIVIIHGGHEHFELPSPRMKKTYRFFVDAGADAVISHHSHCISGYEVYRGAPIFYGIGNFLFDNGPVATTTRWHVGMIVELSLCDTGFSFDKRYIIQNGSSVGLEMPDKEKRKLLEETIGRLNQIIDDDSKLVEEFKIYCKQSGNRYCSYIEPHSSRILHFLRNRNVIPSFLSKRKKLLLLNLIRCEAHREILIHTLHHENSDS